MIATRSCNTPNKAPKPDVYFPRFVVSLRLTSVVSFLKKGMRKVQLFVFLLLVTPVAFASLGSLGKVLLREMLQSPPPLPSGSKNTYDFMSRVTGLKKAAKKIGQDLPEAEKSKVAEELEYIVLRELARRGFSQDVTIACRACIPIHVADSVGTRILDILSDYNALLSKALLATDQIILLDQNGEKIASHKLRRDAFREVVNQYRKIFGDKPVGSWSKYISSISKTISSSGIEAELDAEKKTLSVTLKSGTLKGKVANIDLTKHYKKLEIYIAGGGMAALGYSAGNRDGNGLRTDDMKRKMFIGQSFNGAEREMLIEQVQIEYIVALYKQYKQYKQKTNKKTRPTAEALSD